MDYLKELAAIQTWIKSTTGLNSWRLAEAKPKMARPLILWEMPKRSKDRNLSRYQYVNKVRQYGRLFVSKLEEGLEKQEQLIKDLEEKLGVLPIVENGATIGYLKAVEIDFTDSESLDIPFSITYEVTYGRVRPTEPPHAVTVVNKITSHYNE